MKTISESIETKVRYECDVLVAGGGIAGIAAAMASAREGAKVILLERSFVLGGLATSGLVTIYLPLCDGEGHQVSFGIAEELLKLSIEHGDEGRYPKAWLEDGTFDEKKEKRQIDPPRRGRYTLNDRTDPGSHQTEEKGEDRRTSPGINLEWFECTAAKKSCNRNHPEKQKAIDHFFFSSGFCAILMTYIRSPPKKPWERTSNAVSIPRKLADIIPR